MKMTINYLHIPVEIKIYYNKHAKLISYSSIFSKIKK